MKTTIYQKKSVRGVIILFVTGLFHSAAVAHNSGECQWAPVAQERFAEILNMISARVRDNYERIKTWEGKVKIVSDDVHDVHEGTSRKRLYERILRGPIPDKVNDHREMTREFAVDANKGLLYGNYYSDGENYSIDAETGEKLQFKELVEMGGSGEFVLTPDYLLDCTANKGRDGVIRGHTVVKRARPKGRLTCESGMPPVFDPRESMRIFGDITGLSFDPLGGTLTRYLAYFDKEGGRRIGGNPIITVEECNVGDSKRYRTTLLVLAKYSTRGTIHVFNTLVCSSEAGFNVVLFSTGDSNGRITEKRTWKYGLSGGVYVPVENKELHFDYETGNLKKESALTFVYQKVNHPIASEVFTYKSFGLKDGDKFIDEIAGQEYVYEDGELIPASSGSSGRYPNVNGGHYAEMEGLIILALRWLESEV